MNAINLITSRLCIPRLAIVFFLIPFCLFSQNANPVSQWLEAYREQTVFQPVRVFELLPEQMDAKPVVQHSIGLKLDEEAVDRLLHNPKPTLLLELPNPQGETFQLELAQVAILSPDFFVSTAGQNSTANFPVHPSVHYRGIVQGDEHSLAAISITSSGVSGFVSTEMETFELAPMEDGSAEHLLFPSKNLLGKPAFSCAADGLIIDVTEQGAPAADDRGIGCKTVNIYFECDYKLYQDKGYSVANVTNYVTSLFNQVAALYANENVGVAISNIHVWTSADPYLSYNNTAAVLNAFRQTRGTNFNGNLAHFLTTRSLGGGIAYVEVICFKQYAFGVSCINLSYQNVPTYSWSVEVLTHELGHNLGSWHTQSCNWPNGPIDNCVSPEGSCNPGPPPMNGGTIMSYCHLTSNGINFNHGFGPQPGALIRDKVLNATCLTATGTVPAGLNTSNVTGNSATVSWLPVAGATNYSVQYKLNSSSTWLNGGSTTATVLNINNLSSSSSYSWKVKTDCSDYSVSASFTTGTGSGGSTCVSPSNLFAGNINSYSALLSWTQVSGATSYTIQYKSSNSSTWLTAGSSTNTSYTLGSLSSGTSYNWRVKANCSAYSSIGTFSTANSGGGSGCATPSNLTHHYVYSTSASISWSAINGATSYTLQLKLASSSTYFSLGSIPVTSVTLSGLQPGTSYHWRVKANCSVYSDAKLLTTAPNIGNGGDNASFQEPYITFENPQQWMLYPNPAKDILNIKQIGDSNVQTTVRILDAAGVLKLEQALLDKEPLSIAHLPQGIYFVEINRGGKNMAVNKLAIFR
jgi:hypothetical protein